LQSKHLATLKEEVRHKLQEALIQLNTEAIEQIVVSIRENDPVLADALQVLTDGFRYQDILDMLPS